MRESTIQGLVSFLSIVIIVISVGIAVIIVQRHKDKCRALQKQEKLNLHNLHNRK